MSLTLHKAMYSFVQLRDTACSMDRTHRYTFVSFALGDFFNSVVRWKYIVILRRIGQRPMSVFDENARKLFKFPRPVCVHECHVR